MILLLLSLTASEKGTPPFETEPTIGRCDGCCNSRAELLCLAASKNQLAVPAFGYPGWDKACLDSKKLLIKHKLAGHMCACLLLHHWAPTHRPNASSHGPATLKSRTHIICYFPDGVPRQKTNQLSVNCFLERLEAIVIRLRPPNQWRLKANRQRTATICFHKHPTLPWLQRSAGTVEAAHLQRLYDSRVRLGLQHH